MKKKQIIRGIVIAVLTCMFSTAFASVKIEAAENDLTEKIETVTKGSSQVTYDPSVQRTGYHLEVLSQFPCKHDATADTRTIYTTMTGLTPTPEQVISRIVNAGGLTYNATSYTQEPAGEGAERIGNTVVAIKYGLDPDLYPDVNWQDEVLKRSY